MTTAQGKYLGDLRTENTHLLSGQKLITDAPLDNQGLARAFSPTDLLAASLGNCIATIMGITARDHHFDITGMTWEMTKVMAADPRRVSEIQITFSFPPAGYTEEQKALMEDVPRISPAALSLHPDIKQNITFIW